MIEKTTTKEYLQKVALGIAAIIPYVIANNSKIAAYELPFIWKEFSIPFVPLSFIVYMSFFVQYLVIVYYLNKKQFKHFYYHFIGVVLIACISFLVFPIEYPRNLYPADGWFINFIRIIEQPSSCFPSLHVACSMLYSLWFQKVSKSSSAIWAMWLWTVLIIVSTLTTKQHYIIDIAGGTTLVLISAYIDGKYFPFKKRTV